MRGLLQFLLATLFSPLLSSGAAAALLDPIITSDSTSFTLPFTRAGNLILLQASADTSTGYFVLDTGTPGLVLNITYFRGYASRGSTDGGGGGVTGEVIAPVTTTVDSLRLGSVHYFHVEAGLINLGHIENQKGVKILGLLGMKLFSRFEMCIDYPAKTIHLHLLAKKEVYHNPELEDSTRFFVIPITIEEGKIIVYAYVRGKKLKFIIDSGAETNVLDSRLPGRVFDAVQITRRVTLSGSGSHKVDALCGDLRGLRIGDRDVGVLPVLITNLESMCDAYGNCLDGMLGFDFLSLHKIGFNFVSHQMYIWK